MSRLIYANLKDRDFSYRHKRPDFPSKMIGKHALEAWGHRLDTNKGSFWRPWEQWSEEMQLFCEKDVRLTSRLWPFAWGKSLEAMITKLFVPSSRITIVLCPRIGNRKASMSFFRNRAAHRQAPYP